MGAATEPERKGPPVILAYGFAVVIPIAGLVLGAAVLGRGDRTNGLAVIAVSIVSAGLITALLL